LPRTALKGAAAVTILLYIILYILKKLKEEGQGVQMYSVYNINHFICHFLDFEES
jgi:hypothetical protein